MSNVKNISRRRGAVCREFESETPAAAEENVRLSRMQQRTVQFSYVTWKWWW